MQNQVSRGQGGFTLIELIIVIVILGILAATALPRFTDLSADARLAKIQGARGAVASAASIQRGRYLASNLTGAQANMGGVAMSANGFPTAAAAGIGVAAGGLADFVLGNANGGVIAIQSDAAHANCSFTYDEATGLVSAAPALANC